MPHSPASPTLLKLAGAAFLSFAAFLLVMFEFQARAIFPTHAVAPPGPLPRGAERVTIPAAEDNRLHGVHIPPEGEPAQERALILGIECNAWDCEAAMYFLQDMYPT